jgi:hypothetical protein
MYNGFGFLPDIRKLRFPPDSIFYLDRIAGGLKYELAFLKEYKDFKKMYFQASKNTEKINKDPVFAKKVQELEIYSRPGILCINLVFEGKAFMPLTLEKEGNQRLDLSKFDPYNKKYTPIYVDHKNFFVVNSGLNFLYIDLELEVENEVVSAFSNFARKIKLD